MSDGHSHPVGRSVWIARHGNRIDFVDKTWRDSAALPDDPHLSPDGAIQARQLARRLKTLNADEANLLKW